MTRREILLVLDAICVASEGKLKGPITVAITMLVKELDKEFSNDDKPEFFENYLEEQKAAVVKLANNPAVFGAE